MQGLCGESTANESVANLFAKKLRLEEGVQGRPLNQWLVDHFIVWKGFPGRLYAYPFTISANAEGVNLVSFGVEWKRDGNDGRWGFIDRTDWL